MSEQTIDPAYTAHETKMLHDLIGYAQRGIARCRSLMENASGRVMATQLNRLISVETELAIYRRTMASRQDGARMIGRCLAIQGSSTDPFDNAAKLAEHDGALEALRALDKIVDPREVLYR